MKLPQFLLAICGAAVFIAFALADELGAKTAKEEGAKLNDEAAAAVKKFAVAPGLNVEVWASEPLLANPVALSFDNKGRAYIAETYRRRTSAQDIRKHEDWIIDDLALRTLDQRIAFLKAKFPETAKLKPTKDLPDFNNDGQFDWRDLEVESERIKVVEDSNGDGKADQSRVLADGFNSVATVVGAGVLAQGDDVYYTCIPDVWKIRADGTKEKLFTGFGVHVVYSGHEMHGVKIGPDGRLYWSIADCGAHVVGKEGQVIDLPDCGGIFRCELDGSGLELVAKGLRNPQSLAWNDVGDLFTGDNNADGGDKARWIHVVEGADYGWRIGWQFLPKLGAWNSEGMWHLDAAKDNLTILPPVGHIAHGPAGIAYYPGTGLPDTYNDHFFCADFPGGVRAFKLTSKGASYTVENPDDILQDNTPQKITGKVLWGLYPSDVAFAPGGGLYVLDWIQGWEKTGKGRIFRVFDSASDSSTVVQETKRLLNEGFVKRSDEELVKLLGHADQRVRLGAQFELVRRNKKGPLVAAIAVTPTGVGTLHALWAYENIARREMAGFVKALKLRDEEAFSELVRSIKRGDPQPVCTLPVPESTPEFQLARRLAVLAEPLLPLVSGDNEEVAAQAAKVLGEIAATASSYRGKAGPSNITAALLQLLESGSPRLQYFAAQALSHFNVKLDEVLFRLSARIRDTDPYLRHGIVEALARQGDEDAILNACHSNDPHIRATALLVGSRRNGPAQGLFLNAPDLRNPTAQIMHDGAKPSFLESLAGEAALFGFEETELSPTFWKRVFNANYLLGNPESAKRLAQIALSDKTGFFQGMSLPQRLFALESLTIWNQPFARDRVTGLWRDLPPRSEAKGGREATQEILSALLADPNDELTIEACRAAVAHQIREAGAELEQIVAGAPPSGRSGKVRAAALRALSDLDSPKLREALHSAFAAEDKTLLEAARKLSAKASPVEAVKVNAMVLGSGTIGEQQEALATISQQQVPEADHVISEQLDALAAGKLAPALALDVTESAARRTDPALKAKLAALDQARKPNDPLANWRECLEGGDAKNGREIFFEKAETACLRCHKVKGEGGDVGPDLSGVGKKYDREYLLRSIIEPSAVIAQGYDNVMLSLVDGSIAAGILSAENPNFVTLKSLADGSPQRIEKTKVKERTAVPSAMPPGMGEVLGKRGLRDVVEYLATLK